MGYFRLGIYYDLDTYKIFRLACSDPQSESVTEFPLLSAYKRLESIRCSFRNVKRFQKSFWVFV